MPIPIGGTSSSAVADVRGTTFAALNVAQRPYAHDSYGHYELTTQTGTIAAVLAASAVVFVFRWSDPYTICLVTHLSLRFQTLTPFTANTLTDMGFDAYVARGYTQPYSTNGTNTAQTGNNAKRRTSMGTTIGPNIHILNTNNAGITGGTYVLDGNAFISSTGDSQRVNPAAATEEQYVQCSSDSLGSVPGEGTGPGFVWEPRVANGECPLILEMNEGVSIRNRTVWPAAGTGIVQITIKWTETDRW